MAFAEVNFDQLIESHKTKALIKGTLSNFVHFPANGRYES